MKPTCPNCGTMITCGCQIRTASDGNKAPVPEATDNVVTELLILDANVVAALLVKSIAIIYPNVVVFSAYPSTTLETADLGYKLRIIVTADDTLTSNDFNLFTDNSNRLTEIEGFAVIVSKNTVVSGRDTGTAILSITPLT